ncbi:MAG: bifunctional nuclease family protein [Candidatus Aenigmatarchaeota archaeon]
MANGGRFIIMAIILISVLTLLVLTILSINTSDYEGYIQLSVEGVEYADGSSLIHLGNGCSKFIFYTTKEQGESIEIGMKGIKTARPMTHDILIDILNNFDIKPVDVKINNLYNDTYFAELTLGSYQKKKINIRPSDGIAIAVRAKIPIYVNKSLIKDVCGGLF